MTATLPTTDLLTEDLLARFDERAPVYDREHRFFQEDFDELRDRGLPERRGTRPTFGGLGLSFADVQAMQRRLAYVAPATALAVNMHFYWTGLAADLSSAGDSSCDWMLRASADGAVFAAGHGEAGNDIPLLLSSTQGRARRRRLGDHRSQDLRLAVAGVDLPRPARDGHERPRRTRRSCTRSCRATAEGYRIEKTWDVLGMRATESNDTILDHMFVADEHVALVCPAGFAGAGPVPGLGLRLGPARLRDVYARHRATRVRRDGRHACTVAPRSR